MYIYADPPVKRTITLQQKNAFKNEVFRYLRYFRIPTGDIELSFSMIENDNILFSATVQSRRNNFEEVLVKTYACIGRVMIAVPDSKLNEGQLLILPSIINVQYHVPIGRDNTYFSTSANSKEVIQFTNGVITAEGFLTALKETMDGSFVPYSDKSVSSIMNADVDFENLIAVRMALEGKNNPRLSRPGIYFALLAKVSTLECLGLFFPSNAMRTAIKFSKSTSAFIMLDTDLSE
jgi:hypothetical protein